MALNVTSNCTLLEEQNAPWRPMVTASPTRNGCTPAAYVDAASMRSARCEGPSAWRALRSSHVVSSFSLRVRSISSTSDGGGSGSALLPRSLMSAGFCSGASSSQPEPASTPLTGVHSSSGSGATSGGDFLSSLVVAAAAAFAPD